MSMIVQCGPLIKNVIVVQVKPISFTLIMIIRLENFEVGFVLLATQWEMISVIFISVLSICLRHCGAKCSAFVFFEPRRSDHRLVGVAPR